MRLAIRWGEAAKTLSSHDDPIRARAIQVVAGMPVDQMHRMSDHYTTLSGQYKSGGSSRLVPHVGHNYKPGDWIHDDRHEGLHGRGIEHIREFNPHDLLPSEHNVENNFEGRGEDSKRYAEWLKEGRHPPPISVIETAPRFDGSGGGQYKVTDGHRRLEAAKIAGRKILAKVSYTVQNRDGSSHVGLTHELAKHHAAPFPVSKHATRPTGLVLVRGGSKPAGSTESLQRAHRESTAQNALRHVSDDSFFRQIKAEMEAAGVPEAGHGPAHKSQLELALEDSGATRKNDPEIRASDKPRVPGVCNSCKGNIPNWTRKRQSQCAGRV